MLEDKIRATDFEATTEAIEEQVAQESYLEFLRKNKQQPKNQWSPSSASSSKPNEIGAPRGRNSPLRAGSTREDGTSGVSRTSPRSSPRSVEDHTRVSPRTTAVSESFKNNSGPVPDLAVPGSSKDPIPSSSGFSNIQGFTLNENSSFLNQLPPSMFGEYFFKTISY